MGRRCGRGRPASPAPVAVDHGVPAWPDRPTDDTGARGRRPAHARPPRTGRNGLDVGLEDRAAGTTGRRPPRYHSSTVAPEGRVMTSEMTGDRSQGKDPFISRED